MAIPPTLIGNVLRLSAGSAVARIVSLASIPILTRLFSPAEFGAMAQYMAVTLLLVPLVSLRFPVAIPLPRSDRAAANLVALSLLCTLIVTFLICIVCVFGSELIFHSLLIDAVYPWRWFVVAAVVGTALYELFQFWAIRRRLMGHVAKTQVMQSLIGNGVKICCGVAGYSAGGLIVGQFIQQSAGTLSLMSRFLQDMKGKFGGVSLRRMFAMAKRYRGFPLLRLPSQFLLVLSGQAPLLIMANLFSDATTGQVALAITVLAVPVTLITQSVGDAFFAEIALVWNTDRAAVSRTTAKVALHLAVFALVPSIALFFLAPTLFPLVLGEEWVQAGRFARLLSVALFLQVSTAPLMHILTVMQRNGLFLLFALLRLLIIVISFGWAWQFVLGAEMTIGLYAAGMTLFYSLQAVIIFTLLWRVSLR